MKKQEVIERKKEWIMKALHLPEFQNEMEQLKLYAQLDVLLWILEENNTWF